MRTDSMFAYVGSRTTRERKARGEGLSVFHVDARDGGLERIQLLGELVNPSYLALSADGRRLYAVHGDRTEASAFAVDAASGRLEKINTVDTQGLNPVHLTLDVSDQFLLVTNHLRGGVVVMPIGSEGELLPVTQALPTEGTPGPHRTEQPGPKPHFACFDPSGRWLLVPDKGLDRTFCFRFDGGTLTPAGSAVAREGAGPRHLAVHPRGDRVYVVNELDSTLSMLSFDGATGALAPLHWLPTLPATFSGHSRAAGIAIDAAARTLYASNRGHDSIAVFTLDTGSGLPSFIEAVPTGGRTPRSFTLSPDGARLYALNEDSDSITLFDVAADGRLQATGRGTACGSPVCLVFGGAGRG
jgi:6-phosphogluconolactonase